MCETFELETLSTRSIATAVVEARASGVLKHIVWMSIDLQHLQQVEQFITESKIANKIN